MLASAMFALAAADAAAAPSACPPAGYDRAALLALRERHFDVADAAQRQALAHGLLACLSSPDSELRDHIGYEAYAYWRQGKALDAATWLDIESALRKRLGAADDRDGVARPFAALVLSEVVHADRDTPFLDAARRAALLDAAIAYFTTVRDYRGFDEKAGWRHGVAHAADLLGQLGREPAFGHAELDRILGALATQIVAHDDRVYVFGESERLAAAVALAIGRGMHTTEEWKAWLDVAAAPAPLARWAQAYDSRAGIAKHQNTMNFLLALYAELNASDDAATQAFAAPVLAAMAPLR